MRHGELHTERRSVLRNAGNYTANDADFSETSGTTQKTTQRHIAEELNLQQHRCENLKSDSGNFPEG